MVGGDDKSQLNGGDPVGMELRESVETVARVRRSMFEGVWIGYACPREGHYQEMCVLVGGSVLLWRWTWETLLLASWKPAFSCLLQNKT